MGVKHRDNLRRYDKEHAPPQPGSPLRTKTNWYGSSPANEVLTTILEDWREDVAAGINPYIPRSPSPLPDQQMEIDFDAFGEETSFQMPLDQQQCLELSNKLVDFLENDGQVIAEAEEPSDSSTESDMEEESELDAIDVLRAGCVRNVLRPRTVAGQNHNSNLWYPWPDRETCVLDILRHIPRCAFSRKQNEAIHWAMLALGLQNLPSSRVMDTIDMELQSLCGIRTIRHEGKLGHVYYTNDFAGIVAQEMANPQVRCDLHFYPEDSSPSLSEAWQSERWLHELDPQLTTPMIRLFNQDFYLQEPARLRDGRLVVPTRWLKRDGQLIGKCHVMVPVASGWVLTADIVEVDSSQLLYALPRLIQAFESGACKIADPRAIIGIWDGTAVSPWDSGSDRDGCMNPWRVKAEGKRVYAFPIWLYCDDTSGNSSKKWNKHNSFLFTPAGLPRRRVHHESNIHFLCTSNIAPPLEMLDGIVDQIVDGQRNGILARDSKLNEDVLVIPSVLAMLGDNPMQSELSCHVGFNGNFFCRVCEVSGHIDGSEDDLNPGPPPTFANMTFDDLLSTTADTEDVENGEDVDDTLNPMPAPVQNGGDISRSAPPTPIMDSSMLAGPTHTQNSVAVNPSQTQKNTISGPPTGATKTSSKRVARVESSDDMVTRYLNFMKVGQLRSRSKTEDELKSQFALASTLRSKTKTTDRRTLTGITDRFQLFFLEKLFAITTAKGVSNSEKLRQIREAKESFPEHTTSPVWRIQDLDPHQDTPVEILHVILLGFVKYFWRDAVSRCKKNHATLVARLAGLDTGGLGIPPVTAETLVKYAGSLTGRDFRVIAQVAPFVLHGLMPPENMQVWVALSNLVALVWQPDIRNIDSHIIRITDAIDHFLNIAGALNLGWFNKPKFHVILHLPAHIRRFGPPMLFATEGFESFNAIIRCCSIHSNRHAPSKDIAVAMAKGNRVRHLLSNGHFWLNSDNDGINWKSRGPAADVLLSVNRFGVRFLGLEGPEVDASIALTGEQFLEIYMEWNAAEHGCQGVASNLVLSWHFRAR
ncbi:hypothetical protein V5O48_012589 [Marasmius crinis-equi]|uniref:Uncharacterized protein n=1 Tax=Marasmius crinis-equi TaxID=585013 RepID=A0ABR3F2G4_9AGAR